MSTATQIPFVEYLVLADGEPHLVAHQCTACGARFFDRRNACAGCSGTEFTNALRRDRNAPGCAFVDDRVLRWTAVGDDGIEAARRLRAGPHGVPLCACLTSCAPGDVVSGPGDNLTSAAVGRLAASVAAIAVPFDDSDALVFMFRSACQP